MLWCRAKYVISFPEFFLTDFERLSRSERRGFVGDSERIAYDSRFNKPENKELFVDKFKTYKNIP